MFSLLIHEAESFLHILVFRLPRVGLLRFVRLVFGMKTGAEYLHLRLPIATPHGLHHI